MCSPIPFIVKAAAFMLTLLQALLIVPPTITDPPLLRVTLPDVVNVELQELSIEFV